MLSGDGQNCELLSPLWWLRELLRWDLGVKESS
jgi:hypothetical protein